MSKPWAPTYEGDVEPVNRFQRAEEVEEDKRVMDEVWAKTRKHVEERKKTLGQEPLNELPSRRWKNS
jgi:hypothetical protein